MRFLVEVSQSWDVTVKCVGTAEKWQRAMGKLNADGVPELRGVLPVPQPAAGEARVSPNYGADAKTFADLYNRIIGRNMKAGEIAQYGGYLFDCILGPNIWNDIQAVAAAATADLIEIALSWDPKDANLSRLHWEMMFDGTRFVVVGVTNGATTIGITITRIVPETKAAPKSLDPVPRVLYVIGQPLTDSTIRAGAEVMSLLQHSSLDSQINPAILENASPIVIERKVKSFRPNIVHFICHGMLDRVSKEGKLILQPDPGNPNKNFDANQIAQWLQQASPTMVVLSACDSGSGTALGPQMVSPLAAKLVGQGIPIVIGMSGRVSDLACRLFTRCVGKALISGETLAAATAKGRRAAFAHGTAPADYPDWAFPTVYLSAEVPPDYAPAGAPARPTMADRQQPYGLPLKGVPVFCGRQDLLEAYRDLMEDKSVNVLVAIAPDKTKGYGRTRLLQQLTLRAVVEGHVPCPVLSNGMNWKAPGSTLELASLIDEATKVARKSLGLKPEVQTPVGALQSYKNGHDEDLPPEVRRTLQRTTKANTTDVSDAAIRTAIEVQFKRLMDEARKELPGVITAESRAIVLLDDADEYLHKLLEITDALGTNGLGGEERVPVIMALSAKEPGRDVIGPNSTRTGWNPKELRPFSRTSGQREDMLAYTRVLMNPFDDRILPNVSGKAWFLDYGAPQDAIQSVEKRYGYLNGLPVNFSDMSFYFIADFANEKGVVVEAQDDEALRAFVAKVPP